MTFKILEARAFSSSFCAAPERTVKDYEIDIERTDGRIYYLNGKEYKLSRGDVFFRAPGDVVSSVGAQSSYILTLDFSNRAHKGIYSRNILGEIQEKNSSPLLLKLPEVTHPRSRGALLEIYRTLVNLPDRTSPAVCMLAEEIIYTLNAELAHKEYEAQRLDTTVADTAIRYMAQNLSAKVTLDEIAAEVHLEKSYFVRLFRKETGKTPIAMLVEMRLDRASDLVFTTDMSISDIAAACGYATVSFFISEYKRRFGQTPEAHRRLKKEDQCIGGGL